MSDNNIRAAWLKTTVIVEWQKWQLDRTTGKTVFTPQQDGKEFESLQVKPESQDLSLAVQQHLSAVRDFLKRNPLYYVQGYRTEVCADVKIPDEARSLIARIFLKGPAYGEQCWFLKEYSSLPEEGALASLFRGAEVVVDLLGPVEKNNAAVAKPESPSPTSQPIQGGTNAVEVGNSRETTYLP